MTIRSLIIVTSPWTNPETGISYKSGEVALVPSYLLQNDAHGLTGKYREPAPWEPQYEPGGTAPVEQPPHPDEATKPGPTRPSLRSASPVSPPED